MSFFRVTPAAHGGSQGRGPIGATAAGLCQSHSNAGSEPCLRPTPQLTATLNPLSTKRAITTPETPLTKRSVSARSPHQLLSPSSFSPSATPSQKYSSRSNRGEVVTSFGSTQGVSWSGRGGAGNISLKVLGCPEPLTGSYKSMFQKLSDIREVLTCKIEELGSELKEHYKIEAFTPVLVPAQEPVTLLGQIGCDSNGKLNHKSVILEGDREHSSGAQIPVDLSELKEYSLFPGQVVVMEGINTTGRKLVATRLYEVPGSPLLLRFAAGTVCAVLSALEPILCQGLSGLHKLFA
uniref:DNA polymerase alpha subunit B OB domain-containing protein n=1 Tax=Sus scrofa TaxID=9823 RepID=A0A8D0TFV6_PIG